VRESARHESDFVGVQNLRREKAGTVRSEVYTILYGKGNENDKLGTGFF
jgi:hypothetical protein